MRAPVDESEWQGILLYAEVRSEMVERKSLLALERLRDLASDLGVYVDAILVGTGLSEAAKELVAYGANKVLLAEDKRFGTYDTEGLLALLTATIRSRKPEAVAFADSFAAKDLGPRLAQRFQTSYIPGCTALGVDERQRKIVQTRQMYGGKVSVRHITTANAPQIFSVKVDPANEPFKADYARGQVVSLTDFGTA